MRDRLTVIEGGGQPAGPVHLAPHRPRRQTWRAHDERRVELHRLGGVDPVRAWRANLAVGLGRWAGLFGDARSALPVSYYVSNVAQFPAVLPPLRR